MNLFSRITATIGATAETAVSRFENHEAIAQSALIEARQAVGKARLRHQRMTKNLNDIRSNIQASEKQVEQWTVRAQGLAQSDEKRAMQCLEERQRCRDQIVVLERSLTEHEALELNMAHKLKQLEERLRAMTNQCNEMRSRESLAQATQVMNKVGSQGSEGVDAIFERWELSISDNEIGNSVHEETLSTVSSLQREMDEEDRQSALKDELAELMKDAKETHHE